MRKVENIRLSNGVQMTNRKTNASGFTEHSQVDPKSTQNNQKFSIT